MELSINIKLAISELLKDKVITASWGIKDINITYSSLIFYVNGLKYKGKVTITPDNNVYNIHINNKTIENCKLEHLLKTLDSEIEQTSNYGEDLYHWFIDNSIIDET